MFCARLNYISLIPPYPPASHLLEMAFLLGSVSLSEAQKKVNREKRTEKNSGCFGNKYKRITFRVTQWESRSCFLATAACLSGSSINTEGKAWPWCSGRNKQQQHWPPMGAAHGELQSPKVDAAGKKDAPLVVTAIARTQTGPRLATQQIGLLKCFQPDCRHYPTYPCFDRQAEKS